jgi:hypothetical protein
MIVALVGRISINEYDHFSDLRRKDKDLMNTKQAFG